LGEHIKRRRLDLGLFQTEVANQIGANPSTIANWEKGNTEPAARFIPAIIGLLGYDPRPITNTYSGVHRR
jgi:transcriptional regulator with XRE-family HTH domain